MPYLEAYLFGAFHLQLDEQPVSLPSSPAARSLLAFLLFHHNQVHTRSVLVGHFWPERPERRARRALTQALWHIGQSVPDLITADREHVQIDPQRDIWLDAAAFQELTADLSDAGDAQAWREAVALYKGDFLEGMYDDWLLLNREQLRERYLAARRRLVQSARLAGDLEQALVDALALTTLDPLDEAGHREVMRLYAALDRPAAAQKQFELCRRRLAEELNVEPTAETAALAEAISSQTKAVARPYVPPPLPEPPALAAAGRLPLVGRESERDALLGHLSAVLGGVGGLVLVAGPSGVGKSRLLHALAEDAAWRGVKVLWGTAEAERDVPFGPLVSGLSAELTPLRQRQLRPLLSDTWLAAVAPILPVIKSEWPDLSPLPELPGAEAQTRLYEGLVQLLSALAQRQPLLFLLDDLHWADAATWPALTYLAQRVVDEPVLLVATYRDDEIRDDQTLWQGLQTLDRAGVRQRLVIRPLDQAATGELIRQGLAMGRAPSRFAAHIQRQTAGNPFLILETLRFLYEEGVLQQNQPGQWQTPFDTSTTDYAELAIPPSVQTLLQNRLNRLPSASRQALGAAAVVGHEVSHHLLSVVSSLPAATLMKSVADLVGRQFLVEHADRYRFQHDMIRGVVYEGLSPSERQNMHRRIALSLATGSEGHTGRLAYHYHKGGMLKEAVQAYEQAGRQAAAVYALPTALAAYEQALALLLSEPPPDGLDRQAGEFRILCARLPLWQMQGETAAQEKDVEALLALAAERPEPAWRVEALLQQAAFLTEAAGDYASALKAAEQAVTVAMGADLSLQTMRAYQAMGQAYFISAQYEEAEQALRQALDLLGSAPDAGAAAGEIYLRLVFTYRELGDQAQAWAVAEEALSVVDAEANQLLVIQLHNAMTWLARARGDHQAELGHSQTMRRQAAAMGHRYYEVVALNNSGLAQAALGNVGRAISLLAEAMDVSRQINRPRTALLLALNLGSRYLDVGHFDAAQELYEEMLVIAQELALPDEEARIRLCLARLHTAREAFAPAARELEETEAILRKLDLPYMWATFHYRKGLFYLAQADYTAALVQFEQAEAGYNRSGWPEYAVNVHAYQAACLSRRKRPAGAAALVTHAYQAMLARGEERVELPTCYYFWQIMTEVGAVQGAQAVLERAVRTLEKRQASLDNPELARSYLNEVPINRDIMAAWQAFRPATEEVLLPCQDAPFGRALTAAEQVRVVWTVAAPEDDDIAQKTARRRHRLRRLLVEAEAQGAAPAYHHLAEALAVSERTIARDMAVLRRKFPNLPPTRRV